MRGEFSVSFLVTCKRGLNVSLLFKTNNSATLFRPLVVNETSAIITMMYGHLKNAVQ